MIELKDIKSPKKRRELKSIKNGLNEWEWKTTLIISQIPEGTLLTYHAVKEWAEQEQKLDPKTERNIGILRNKLYTKLGHDTIIPLHRIMSRGDLESNEDSEQTKFTNKIKRTIENTWQINQNALEIIDKDLSSLNPK